MRYFITFSCYGSRLHGDKTGSVDRKHNVFGGRLAEANAGRVAAMREEMDQPPYFLDQVRRKAVLDALREVCLHQGWSLWAAHVRTNHVHVIVEADVRPEKVIMLSNPMPAVLWTAWGSTNRSGNDGRATAARAGYGRMRTHRNRFATSFTNKGNRWKFTWQPVVEVRKPSAVAGSWKNQTK